jgi:hypothetical protein
MNAAFRRNVQVRPPQNGINFACSNHGKISLNLKAEWNNIANRTQRLSGKPFIHHEIESWPLGNQT